MGYSSLGSQIVGHYWVTENTNTHIIKSKKKKKSKNHETFYHLHLAVIPKRITWLSQKAQLVRSRVGIVSSNCTVPVTSRLLQLYSTDNETSRLMVKRFFTVRDTQRSSQSYMKKRRGRREIEMSRRRKRGTQEERDRSTQLSVPKVFSVAQTPTEIHRIGLGREGERRK